MKLNSSSKEKIRKEIEGMLIDIPEGEKIKLDKDILEDLLFAKSYVYGMYENSKKNVLVKYIIWSGDFLSKIDLSEVSFEDVEWRIDYFKIYGSTIGAHKNYYEGVNQINLSNTNAKIDFSKSYQVKNYDEHLLDINGVNFENTDLSTSNLNSFASYIVDTNLSNTNIKFMPRSSNPFLEMIRVNLKNVDLSDFYVNGENFSEHGIDACDWFKDCDLSNTKIKITFNKDDIYYEDGDAHENIISMLNDGKLEGCYLNGNLIKNFDKKTNEEIENMKQQKLKEYILFEKNIRDSIIGSIQKQSRKFK